MDGNHHSNPPPLVPPKSYDRDVKPAKTLDNNLFRPFDNKGLSNGVNNSHCVDYSRSRLDTKICDKADTQSRYSSLDIVKKEHNDVFQKTIADAHSISRTSDSGLIIPDRNKVELTVPQVHRNHLLQQSPERIKKEMISKPKNDLIPNHKPNMSLLFPFDDNFRQKLESQVEHVVSKLDLDEKRLQASRAQGSCSSDSDFDESEVEEKRKEKLLLVTSGPPLKLHTPRTKMKFLANLELTSQGRKKGEFGVCMQDFSLKLNSFAAFGELNWMYWDIKFVCLAFETEMKISVEEIGERPATHTSNCLWFKCFTRVPIGRPVVHVTWLFLCNVRVHAGF